MALVNDKKMIIEIPITMASKANIVRAIGIPILSLIIFAMISTPPVVPPALKIIPNPVPTQTPIPIAEIIISFGSGGTICPNVSNKLKNTDNIHVPKIVNQNPFLLN